MFQNFPWKTSQIPVLNTATLISAANPSRSGITVTNTTTTAAYLGENSGTTTANGALLAGIVGASVSFSTTGPVYGISSGSTVTVTVLETM